MSPLSRWFVRTALAYFVAALFVGVGLMLRLVIGLPPAIAALQPVYFHFLMVGWVTQLIFGVVFWMFPKYSASRRKTLRMVQYDNNTFLTPITNNRSGLFDGCEFRDSRLCLA